MRRAGDRTPLGRIVADIEESFASGDDHRTAALIDRDPLAAWYGLTTDALGRIVHTLEQRDVPVGMFIRIVSAMFLGATPEGFQPENLGTGGEGSVIPPELGAILGQLFALRLAGRPVEALRLTAQLDARRGALQLLFDTQGGWALFGAVQMGLTAMLAGDFVEARERLTQARLHILVPHLSFLSRDASAKLAVVEALYGDAERARSLLREAEQVPRTESWAEPLVDVAVTIATALVGDQSAEESVHMLAGIPLRDVGEMWPFYVAVQHRVLVSAGREDTARKQLETFDSMPLPRIDGQGYAGSVTHLCRAWNATLNGDFAEARERVVRADGELTLTRLVAGRLELATGRPREAILRVEGLHEQTLGLRQLDLLRLGVIAGSHFGLGEVDDARGVLQLIVTRADGLTPNEAAYFPAEVRRFARAEVSGWPEDSESGVSGTESEAPLTARELEMLRELAGGRSREEIARSQFISLNTLKAHLRSIYRKLGVRSRGAAIIEAERRGLI